MMNIASNTYTTLLCTSAVTGPRICLQMRKILIAKVQTLESPFAMLQTFSHALLFLQKTSRCNLLKTSLSFLLSQQNIWIFRISICFFLFKKSSKSGNFETLMISCFALGPSICILRRVSLLRVREKNKRSLSSWWDRGGGGQGELRHFVLMSLRIGTYVTKSWRAGGGEVQ